MKTIKFQVSTKWFENICKLKVLVYSSVEEMRAASLKWNGESLDHAYGITNKHTRMFGEKLEKTEHLAIIRLSKTHINAGLVVHEVTHAAAFFFTAEGNKLVEDDIEAEELLCYIVGDLFSKVNRKLHDYGVWK